MTPRFDRPRLRGRRLVAALAALVGLPMVLITAGTTAEALVAPVTLCVDDPDQDLQMVQAAVNNAADGEVINIAGTCDFSAAAAAGGSGSATIANAAVLIRPDDPIDGLTIKSWGNPQSAVIKGGGDEAAFVIGPGNKNVTITGLQFQQVGVAVVVLNDADGATVGSADGGVPSVNANRILGTATTTAGVKVYASPLDGDANPATAFGVKYGTNGATTYDFGASTSHLDDVTVAGNYISFDPPGAGDSVNPLSVVGIDVRDRGYQKIDGVDIRYNAIGMATPAPAYYGMRGISFYSHCCADDGDKGTLNPDLLPGDFSPANRQNQYFTRHVNVVGNNLGRFEEIQDALNDIDPALADGAADFTSTGRSGISLLGVGSFSVRSNGVRTIGTGTAIPMPTGGIVVSDSGYGEVRGNGVIGVVDESVGNADLGAVAVIDDASELLGDAGHEQHTENVLVKDNTVGPVTYDVPGATWARRGLVVDAAERVTVTGNNVKGSSADALNVSQTIVGPGSPTNPNASQTPLPARVRDSVFCDNTLDGEVDDPAEVSYNAAGATRNSGNGVPGQFGDSAIGCSIEVAPLSDSYIDVDDSLVVNARGWGNGEITAKVFDQFGTPTEKSEPSDADGNAVITFAPADLAALASGPIGVVASANSNPAGYTGTSEPQFITLNKSADLADGVVAFIGGDDGFLNANEIGNLGIWWQSGDPTATQIDSRLTIDGVVPDPLQCEGTGIPQVSGSARAAQACIDAVAAAPEGATIAIEVTWKDDDGHASNPVTDSAVKDAGFAVNLSIAVVFDADGDATVTGQVTGDDAADVVGKALVAVQEPKRLFGLLDGRVLGGEVPVAVDGTFSIVLDTSQLHDGELLFGSLVFDRARNQAPVNVTATKTTGETPVEALVEDAVEYLTDF